MVTLKGRIRKQVVDAPSLPSVDEPRDRWAVANRRVYDDNRGMPFATNKTGPVFTYQGTPACRIRAGAVLKWTAERAWIGSRLTANGESRIICDILGSKDGRSGSQVRASRRSFSRGHSSRRIAAVPDAR
jgi:hypothetical protein